MRAGLAFMVAALLWAGPAGSGRAPAGQPAPKGTGTGTVRPGTAPEEDTDALGRRGFRLRNRSSRDVRAQLIRSGMPPGIEYIEADTSDYNWLWVTGTREAIDSLRPRIVALDAHLSDVKVQPTFILASEDDLAAAGFDEHALLTADSVTANEMTARLLGPVDRRWRTFRAPTIRIPDCETRMVWIPAGKRRPVVLARPDPGSSDHLPGAGVALAVRPRVLWPRRVEFTRSVGTVAWLAFASGRQLTYAAQTIGWSWADSGQPVFLGHCRAHDADGTRSEKRPLVWVVVARVWVVPAARRREPKRETQ